MRDGKGKNKLKLKSLYLCHEWADFLIQKQKTLTTKQQWKKHPTIPPPKYNKEKSLSVAKSRRQRSWAESCWFWARCPVAWHQGMCPASLLWCSQTGWRELGLFLETPDVASGPWFPGAGLAPWSYLGLGWGEYFSEWDVLCLLLLSVCPETHGRVGES